MQKRNCILCGREASFAERTDSDEVFFNCPNCGRFYCLQDLMEDAADFLTGENKPLLSGYIRERTELSEGKGPVVKLDSTNITDILNSPIIPRTVSEKIDKLILYFARKTKYLHQWFPLSGSDVGTAACYALNDQELQGCLKHLIDEEIIIRNPNFEVSYSLTVKGHEHAREIMKTVFASNTAFVAMWFSGEMDSAYQNAIKPAIESEECGHFKAFRVDKKEHNNDITDEIIAEIKASRFVVADMTGYRGGVYYEAGYARGLGKEVIITCRKDWFDGDEKDGEWIKERIHFDINHLNIIVWETEGELKQRLINRIRATIL